MIDFHKIAQGLAENLCRRSTLDPSNTETLIREAFQRGFQLGLSIRDPHERPHTPNDKSPRRSAIFH
jgi:hypothetical protein